MSNCIIREANFSDIPYIYEICLKTGDSGKDATSLFHNSYMLGQYYAANYMYYEKDLFLVAELEQNDTGTPQGYCIGCSNTELFSSWMDDFWLPQLQKQFPLTYKSKSENEKHLLESIHKKYSHDRPEWGRDFPAHLHIDLLPSLRGSGCGRQLMETLFERLRQKHISGVHLGVGNKNENAIGFYKKLGFFVLEEKDWGLLLGYSL